MEYKITFPTGYNEYNVPDELNGNIDTHVITAQGDVYFGVLFTLQNIAMIMKADNLHHWWALDMIIVKDLSKKTIRTAVDEIIRDNILDKAFDRIGNIEEIYCGEPATYEEIVSIA